MEVLMSLFWMLYKKSSEFQFRSSFHLGLSIQTKPEYVFAGRCLTNFGLGTILKLLLNHTYSAITQYVIHISWLWLASNKTFTRQTKASACLNIRLLKVFYTSDDILGGKHLLSYIRKRLILFLL